MRYADQCFRYTEDQTCYIYTGKCVFSKVDWEVRIPKDQLYHYRCNGLWREGALLPIEREFLWSGISPRGWVQTFGLEFEQIEQMVLYLIKMHPNHIYQKCGSLQVCSYVDGGDGKGCIFGQAISFLDPSLDLHHSEGITRLLNRLGVEATEDEENWASDIQKKQDKGRKWDELINTA